MIVANISVMCKFSCCSSERGLWCCIFVYLEIMPGVLFLRYTGSVNIVLVHWGPFFLFLEAFLQILVIFECFCNIQAINVHQQCTVLNPVFNIRFSFTVETVEFKWWVHCQPQDLHIAQRLSGMKTHACSSVQWLPAAALLRSTRRGRLALQSCSPAWKVSTWNPFIFARSPFPQQPWKKQVSVASYSIL